MHRYLLLSVLVAALLGLAPAASAQPSGDDLDGLIALLQTRVTEFEGLAEPTKPEKKTAKLIQKQLDRLLKPSTALSKDARALRRVLKPLQNKLADDIPIQQELVIAASKLYASVLDALVALEVEFEGLPPGPKLSKAMKSKAKAEALLRAVVVEDPLTKRVKLTAKAAKRGELAGAQALKAAPELPSWCPGTPVALNETVTALADGEPWEPTSVGAHVTYAADGVTILAFSLSFHECGEVYRWVRYTLSDEPQVDLPYFTSIHFPTALNVSGGADDDPTDTSGTVGVYLGGVGITFTEFDPVAQYASGTFYGFLPEPPPSFASQQLTEGQFEVIGFSSFVQSP